MMADDMPSSLPLCWIVTEGLKGLQNQAIGLAEALGFPYLLKEINKPKSFWRLLPPFYWPSSIALTSHGHRLNPPWPDVLISCGRSSVATSLAIKKASAGKTFTVHIQDPQIDPVNFDIVIAPRHDRIEGSNVLVTQGAIHHVTREKLIRAADHFRPLLASLPRPLFAVLIGGNNRHQEFSYSSVRHFADKLSKAAQNAGGGLAITPSRRTGAAIEQLLREHLKGVPAYIWDQQTENPYLGLLALADVIVVTSDSISMISEACFTGKSVYVYELPGCGRRHKEFLNSLLKKGMIRLFSGKIEMWEYPPLDETQRAADFVRERFARMPYNTQLSTTR
jgi:mitochondrial fission protein ELM1